MAGAIRAPSRYYPATFLIYFHKAITFSQIRVKCQRFSFSVDGSRRNVIRLELMENLPITAVDLTGQKTSGALMMILDALVDAIAAAGELGAPGGILYAALMSHGCSLSTFQSLMGILERADRVTRCGERYFVKGATVVSIARCVECGRVFDLTIQDDAAEWTAGHDCEA